MRFQPTAETLAIVQRLGGIGMAAMRCAMPGA
jgi:hypothetical protein